MKPRLLHAIQTRGRFGDHDLDTDLVPSLSNEEIRVSQKLDPELCRFMELLHKHTVKPNAKSLKEEPPYVKIFSMVRIPSLRLNSLSYWQRSD